MFEDELEFVSELKEAASLLAEVTRDAAEGRVGAEIRRSVLLSDETLALARRYITENQLWDNQIDMYGVKAPKYSPDTIRKKARLGYSADKLDRYTQKWNGAFYDDGIIIEIDEGADEWKIVNSLAMPHFQYIPDRYIGLTDENYDAFMEFVNDRVEGAQIAYIKDAIESAGYGDIINVVNFIGYDFAY